MWYIIHASDREDSLMARKEARPAHLARLKELLANQTVVSARRADD